MKLVLEMIVVECCLQFSFSAMDFDILIFMNFLSLLIKNQTDEFSQQNSFEITACGSTHETVKRVWHLPGEDVRAKSLTIPKLEFLSR